jgi:hypothetical protein
MNDEREAAETDPILRPEEFRVARPQHGGKKPYGRPTLEPLGNVWDLTTGSETTGSDAIEQASP